MIQQVIEDIGSLEDGEALVKMSEELTLNFLKSLFFCINDLKNFIKFFSFQHLILLLSKKYPKNNKDKPI